MKPTRQTKATAVQPRKTAFILAGSIAALLAVQTAAPSARAANVIWDIAPGTVGAGDSAVTGGTGTWDETLGNWTINAGANNIAWSNASHATDTAVFGGTAGTVTLGAAISAGGMTFNDNAGYVVTGNTITLGGGATITANVNATVASTITGSAGLTKAGAGTLTLSGAQTYTGSTIITGGTLKIAALTPVSGMNAWFDASTVTGYTDGQNMTAWTDLSATGNHNATRTNGQMNYTTNQVNGLSVVQFRGAGIGTLAGNLYSAQEYAVFSLPNGGDWGAILGSNNDNQGYLLNRDGHMWDGRYPNGVAQNGTALSQNYQLSNIGNFMVVKIDNRNGNTSATGGWKLGGQEGWNNFDMNLAEVISYDHVLNATEENQVGSYLGSKYGIGTTYTGGGTSLPTTTALAITGGSTLDLSGTSQTVASLSDYAGTGGTVALGTGGKLTVGDATSTAFSGILTGTGGKLTKVGAGALTLTGTSTYTGSTGVSDGTLNMANLGATTGLGLGAAGTAGRLNYSGGAVASAAGITVGAGGGRFDHAGSGAVTLNGTVTGTGGNLTIGGSGDTVLAKGTSLGAGTLTKVDAGMLTSASNTVGAATISGGTMVANTISGTASVNSGGTLKMQGAAAPVSSGLNAWFDASTVSGYTNGQNMTAWTDLSETGNHTATRTNGQMNYTTNQVNGLSAVQFRGAGIGTLAGNLYSAQEYAVFSLPNGGDWGAILGSNNDNQGYLINRDGHMWDGRYPNGVAQNGTALSQNYQLSNIGDFMVVKIDNRNGNTSATGGWKLGGQEGWNNLDMNLAEVISYDHVLTAPEENQVGFYLGNKYGVSTTYTNPGAGTGPGSLGGLAGSGILDLNATTVKVGANNASTTFSGTMLDSVGGGTLVKKGAGTLTLTGSGTYTGATTITAGKVQVSSPGSYASTYTVNSGTLGGSGTVGGIVLSSTGLLTPGDEGGTVGTLTAGSVTLNAGGVMDFEFSGANNDLINVTTANGLAINGGSFHLYQAGGTSTFSTLGTYNLFQYSTGFTGLGNIGTTSILNKISGLHYGFSDVGNTYVALTISAGPVWNGGGGDNLWSSSANWTNVSVETNDTVVYSGSTRPTSTNDLTLVTQLRSIVFKNTATGAFTLGGNGLTLIADFDGNLVRNDSTATQTINLPVTVGVAGAFVNTTNAAGTTVLGGTVNNNGNTLLVTGPGSTTVSATGTITGSGGLTKSGGGTLAINAATDFSGNTRIAAGTLTVGHQNALVNTTVDMNTADAGALTFTATTATLGGLTGARNINMGPANVSIGAKNVDTTYKGDLTGGTGLAKVGSAVLELGGNNSYGGATLISTGTLRLSAAYPTSGLLGRWTFDAGTAADTSGNGYNGTAVGSPTYSGADTHGGSGNALVLNGSSAISVSTGGSQSVFDGGTAMTVSAWVKGWPDGWNPFVGKNGEPNGWQMRKYSDSNQLSFTRRGLNNSDFQGSTSVVSNGAWHNVTMTFDGSTSKIYVDGALDATDNNGGTIAASTSLLMFGARDNGGIGNFFTGKLDDIYFYNRAITLAEVSVLYSGGGGGADRIPDTSLVTVTGGATLDLNDNQETVGPLAGAGSVTLGATTLSGLTVNSTTGNNTTFSGVISGAGAFTKAGPAALTLSGANTFTGDSRIAAGALKVGTPLALQNSTLDMNAADAGTFDMNGNDATLGGLNGTRNITVIASHTLSIGSNNQLTTYSGALTGLGALTKIGTGTSSLTGTNTYSGATTIGGGVLNVGSGSGLSANSNLAFNGTNPVLEQSGTFSRAVGSGAGQVQWVTGGGFAAFGGALAVQLGGNTSQVTWSGTIGNGNSLVLNSTSANNVADFQNALNLGGSARTVQVLENTGSTADWGRISGTISNGSLVKTGPGLLALAGNNTFTGGVAIGAGTVQVAHTGALNSATPNAVSFTPGSTGTLQLNGNSVTVSSLSTDGGSPGTAFVVNSHTTAADLTVNKTSGTDTFAGVLQDGTGGGALGLTKAGGGTLILTGANTYTGATAVTGGTLQGTTATLPSAIAVSAGANVTFNQTSDGDFKKNLSGAGSLTKEGGAVLTLKGNNTNTGTTFINTGTVKLGAPAPELSVTGGLNAWFDASTLALGNGQAINTWTDLSGQNHTATKSGGGTITLATNQVNGLSVAQFRNGGREAILSGSLYSAQEYAVFSLPNGGDWGAILGSNDGNQGYLLKSSGFMWDGRYPNGVSQNGGAALSPNYQLSNIGNFMVVKIDNRNGNTSATSGWRLGAQEGWNNFDMNLAEVISYDHVLNATDEDLVGGYLETKYGIATAYNAAIVPSLNNIGDTSAVAIASGATLDVNGTTEIIGSLSGLGSVTLGGGTLTINSVANANFGGLLSGAGALTKSGAGVQTLSGASASTYAGATRVLQGTLALDFANLATPTNMVSASSPLVLGGGRLMVIAKTGAATAQTFASTTAGAGDSAVEAAGGAGENANITLGTITRQLGGTVDFNVTATAGSITATNGNTNGILGGWATYAGSTWAVSSSGITGLASYASDFSAGSNNVDVTAGNGSPAGSNTVNSLRFNGNSAVTLTIAAGLTLNSGGVLVTSAVGANGTLITGGTLQAAAGLDLVLIQNNTSAALTINSIIADDGSGVTKSGAGALILGGANTFTGPLRINGGSVAFGGSSSSGPVSFGAGSSGVLKLLGQTITVGGLSGDLASPGSSAVENAIASPVGTLVINNSADYAFAGVLRDGSASAATNLVKSGAGTQILAGSNTFTGTVAITGGVLQLGSTGALNSASPRPVSLANAGTLRLAGNSVTVSSLSGASASSIVENMSASAAALTVNKAAGTDTYAGILRNGTGAGALGVTKTGAGTLVLTGANTLTGTMTVAGGTLQGNTTSLPSAIVLANSANVTFDQGSDATYGKVISGTGSLTKAGAGVLSISEAHTYSGPTYITAGTLRLAPSYTTAGLVGRWTFDGGNAADSSGNGYNGAAVGTPTYSSADTHGGSGSALVLDGSGSAISVSTGGSQSVFDGGTSMTVSAWVKGWPGQWGPFVSKNGEANGWQMRKYGDSNKLSFEQRGNSSIESNTTVVSDGQWHMVTMSFDGSTSNIYVDGALDKTANNAGTIAASPNLLVFGARDVGGLQSYFNGKLDDIYFYNRPLTSTEVTALYNSAGEANRIPNTSLVAISAAATLDLNDNQETVGPLSGAGSVALGIGNLTVNSTADSTFAGVVSGAGTLTKAGASTLTLTGVNTHTFATAVSAGILSVAADTALGANSATLKFTGGTLKTTAGITASRPVDVAASGGTFNTNGFDSTLSGVVSGSGVLTKSGSGKLSVTGTSNTLSGSFSVTAGTLSGNAASLTAPVALSNNANVTFDQGTAGTYRKAISGTGSLTKEGSGTLTLSTAQHSYVGDTVISAGTLKLQGVATAPPVAGYARWFDASTLALGNGANVTQWNDGSGNNAHATVPGGNQAPTFLANAGTETGLGALHFNQNGGANNSGALSFASDSSIRTVFSIFKGASFLLTDSGSYNFHRPGDSNAADPLWDGGNSSANIRNGTTYVNGAAVNGTTLAMPSTLHGGYNLVELLTTGNVTASSFNKDRTYHSGDQSQAEVIIYDFLLDNTQRLAVETYLNAKWFGIGSNGSASDLLPIGTAVKMASGTTLDLNGVNQQIASLADAAGSPTGQQVLLGGVKLTIGATPSTAETTFTGAISGTGASAVEKVGSTVQDLNGTQSYNTLTVSGGTLNVNGALDTGTAAVVVAAGAKLKFGSVSQTLSSLSIGAGTTVTFSSGTAMGAFSGGGGVGGKTFKAASLGGSPVVPEPGTLGLLLVGALGLLNRRRRQ